MTNDKGIPQNTNDKEQIDERYQLRIVLLFEVVILNFN